MKANWGGGYFVDACYWLGIAVCFCSKHVFLCAVGLRSETAFTCAVLGSSGTPSPLYASSMARPPRAPHTCLSGDFLPHPPHPTST